MSSFHDFSLQSATLATLAHMDITQPTPIQAQAIPVLLAGNDLVGQSATGSGKTLAYGIPLVERVARNRREVQALVLLPTRELAVQVNTVLSKFAASRRLSTALLVGGRAYSQQISALRYGAQIVIGTPGRVQDHLERGSFVLNQLRICVLDEADQMLDSGFAPMVEEILTTTPETRQMALFSATLPAWVQKLQEKFLKDPVSIQISPAEASQSTIEQIAYQVPREQKMAALCTLLLATRGESSLIFGKTKFGVERLGNQLSGMGFTVATLHGDKSQRARDEVLTAFRKGSIQTLLATNVAARGLDIQGIHQVINYELPESSDVFTHRIGRTGRMGQQGKAITLLVPSDVPKWRRMARNLGQAVVLQQLVINKDVTITPSTLVLPEVNVPISNNDHELSVSDRRERVPQSSSERDTMSISKRPRGERMKRDLPARQIQTASMGDVSVPARSFHSVRNVVRNAPNVVAKQSHDEPLAEKSLDDKKKTFAENLSDPGRVISKEPGDEKIVREPFSDKRDSRERFENKRNVERLYDKKRPVHRRLSEERISPRSFEEKRSSERSSEERISTRSFGERRSSGRASEERISARSFEKRRSPHARLDRERNSPQAYEERSTARREFEHEGGAKRAFSDKREAWGSFRDGRGSGRFSGDQRPARKPSNGEKISREFFSDQVGEEGLSSDDRASSGRTDRVGKASGKARARAYVAVQKQRKAVKRKSDSEPMVKGRRTAKK